MLRQVGLVRPVRYSVPRPVGPVGPVREPKLSTPPYGGGGGGLKISIILLLFPFHEGHKIEHEKERANNPAFLSVGFLIASTNTIRMSANRIRKPADRIRKLTGGIRL